LLSNVSVALSDRDRLNCGKKKLSLRSSPDRTNSECEIRTWKKRKKIYEENFNESVSRANLEENSFIRYIVNFAPKKIDFNNRKKSDGDVSRHESGRGTFQPRTLQNPNSFCGALAYRYDAQSVNCVISCDFRDVDAMLRHVENY